MLWYGYQRTLAWEKRNRHKSRVVPRTDNRKQFFSQPSSTEDLMPECSKAVGRDGCRAVGILGKFVNRLECKNTVREKVLKATSDSPDIDVGIGRTGHV